MSDDKLTSVNTVPEDSYLTDFYEGERLRAEQEFFGPYVRRPLGGGQAMPAVEAEGANVRRPWSETD